MIPFQLHNCIYISIFFTPVARNVELLLNDGILVLNGGRGDDSSLSVNDSAAATLSNRGDQKKYICIYFF